MTNKQLYLAFMISKRLGLGIVLGTWITFLVFTDYRLGYFGLTIGLIVLLLSEHFLLTLGKRLAPVKK